MIEIGIYCIVCYLFSLGVLVERDKTIGSLDSLDCIILILSPITVPIGLGMHITSRLNK